MYAASPRQKMNTKSSTEAELVRVADLIPQVMMDKIFSRRSKVFQSINPLYTKTTKMQCCWNRMGVHQAASGHAASTFATIL